MTKPWYDTKAGIRKALGSLEEFHALVRERGAAGYDRGERMAEYIVGPYWLDTCGNCGRIRDDGVKLLYGQVETREEFFARQGPGTFTSTSVGGWVYAPPGVTCAVCRARWAMETAHDIVVDSDTTILPTTGWTGFLLSDARRELACRTDAVFRIGEYPLRSDARVTAENPFGNSGRDVPDAYTFVPGDELFVTKITFRHVACARADAACREGARMRRMSPWGAQVVAVPNQYSSHPAEPPWFQITSKDGRVFVVGRRKRVWTVNYETVTALDLFPEESATHGPGYVHAWTEARLEEIIRRVCSTRDGR